MLKTGQAVIGRRAIDRAMMGYGDKTPLAVLLTANGSQAICQSFKFKKPDLKIIENFSQDLLIKITGREKISYYCILNTEMGINFLNPCTPGTRQRSVSDFSEITASKPEKSLTYSIHRAKGRRLKLSS